MRYGADLILCIWLLAAPGFSYAATENFANAWPTVNAYAKGRIEVWVIDERPYVKSGSKKDSYVGATRSLYGIPFNMETESSLPLARDIETAVVKGYETSGMEASTAPSGSRENRKASTESAKLLVITLKEWMIDRYVSAGFWHDIQADVYDHAGRMIGTHSVADSRTVESPLEAGRLALRNLLSNTVITSALAKLNVDAGASLRPSSKTVPAGTGLDAGMSKQDQDQ